MRSLRRITGSACALILAAGLLSPCRADDTASDATVPFGTPGWVEQGTGSEVLLIETGLPVAGSVGAALASIVGSFDYYRGADFHELDLEPYRDIILAMDGGRITAASVDAMRSWAKRPRPRPRPRRTAFLGGSSWPEYAQSLNDLLAEVDLGDIGWRMSASPHVASAHPGDPLSQGLPAPSSFADARASYYMARSRDGRMHQSATNGDGESLLFWRELEVEASIMLWAGSPYEGYYQEPGDLAILRQVISNMLVYGPSPTEPVTWGVVKSGAMR
jgi:hypothetical protein